MTSHRQEVSLLVYANGHFKLFFLEVYNSYVARLFFFTKISYQVHAATSGGSGHIHHFQKWVPVYCLTEMVIWYMQRSFNKFHRAFRFTKFYLYQRMHLFLSYTKITFYK